MTQLLERAYARIAQLPEPEQDTIASLHEGKMRLPYTLRIQG